MTSLDNYNSQLLNCAIHPIEQANI